MTDRQSRSLPIPPDLAGVRLDQTVATLLGLSRTVAADLIDTGDVRLDDVAVSKSTKVSEGQWLDVLLPAPPEPLTAKPVAVPDMHVVYSDDSIVVVNKPVGVAAHPSVGWGGQTVIGGLAAAGHMVATSGAAERQGVVHRLDVGTTGLMVVAKSERAYTVLKRAFKERTVAKGYHAVVQGHPDPLRGTIDAPIDRHPSADWKFAVVAGGKPSVTHYETLEAFPAASLVAIRLETGRTHQIRVHFAALRHPCVGDAMYGADPTLSAKLKLTRQWLHARTLGFEHPEHGEWVEFTADYPEDLAAALAALRGES